MGQELIEHYDDIAGLTLYAKPSPLVASPWGDDVEALDDDGAAPGRYFASVDDSIESWLIFEQTGASPSVSDMPPVAYAKFLATAAQATAIETDTQDIQGRLPEALVSGRIDSRVGAMANDVITASAYDKSTAFPLKSEDSGSTQLARTGADSDTLEDISDQIDGLEVPQSITASITNVSGK